jgi:hypothetical protein
MGSLPVNRGEVCEENGRLARTFAISGSKGGSDQGYGPGTVDLRDEHF